MNKYHPLIYQLSKLKESSKEAIADAQLKTEDELKKYLHVERSVETDLRNIISAAASKPGSSLIMVCGNVGDGKSHLLSKLNQDNEFSKYMSVFNVHNDATESFSPDQTCIQTLRDILQPFSNENISTSSEKWILAINLGTLSNFLEEHAASFSAMRQFVTEHGIVNADNFEVSNQFIEESNFQYINFTNHHFYDLTINGVTATLFEKLFEKIVSDAPENPIHAAYQQLCQYSWSDRCPVRINFEFFAIEQNRKVIAKLLVECILKEKLIISFRQILNFVHDIIVPYELAIPDVGKYADQLARLSARSRLDYHLLNYIFERPQLSKIFTCFYRLDPSIRRYELLDEKAIALFTSVDPIEIFGHDFPELGDQLTSILSSNIDKQQVLFKAYQRLNFFYNHHSGLYDDDYFLSFTKALYFSNIRDAAGLKDINELVKNAAMLWNGSTLEQNKIMFSNLSRHSSYRLFRNIQFRSILPRSEEKINKDMLHQFISEVRVEFALPKGGDPSQDKLPIGVDVDYSLYVLLQKVNKGYRPNKLDRNSFINFVTMVDKLIYQNSADEELFIDEVNIGYHLDYKLELNEYNEFEFSKLNKQI
jgi:DNA phosphorothioation-dependent restriction protein DptF